jgi:hypothetical protein
VIHVPVEFLVRGRQPDAELHRLIALSGGMTTAALHERTRLARYVIDNACRRLARIGMLTTSIRRHGNRRITTWHMGTALRVPSPRRFRTMLRPKAA